MMPRGEREGEFLAELFVYKTERGPASLSTACRWVPCRWASAAGPAAGGVSGRRGQFTRCSGHDATGGRVSLLPRIAVNISGMPSEPENQSNLNKNTLWKHWVFSVNFRARGHSFSNSQALLRRRELE